MDFQSSVNKENAFFILMLTGFIIILNVLLYKFPKLVSSPGYRDGSLLPPCGQ